MKKILFDTDVLIELLRGNQIVEDQIRQLILANDLIAMTPVSLGEIYQGLRSNEKIKTKETLSVFARQDISCEAGQRAGEYLRQYSKSHGLELPDALIATTALINHYSLCTFNWKHYPMSELNRHQMERQPPP